MGIYSKISVGRMKENVSSITAQFAGIVEHGIFQVVVFVKQRTAPVIIEGALRFNPSLCRFKGDSSLKILS